VSGTAQRNAREGQGQVLQHEQPPLLGARLSRLLPPERQNRHNLGKMPATWDVISEFKSTKDNRLQDDINAVRAAGRESP